jgi:hypothetical protein
MLTAIITAEISLPNVLPLSIVSGSITDSLNNDNPEKMAPKINNIEEIIRKYLIRKNAIVMKRTATRDLNNTDN